MTNTMTNDLIGNVIPATKGDSQINTHYTRIQTTSNEL